MAVIAAVLFCLSLVRTALCYYNRMAQGFVLIKYSANPPLKGPGNIATEALKVSISIKL
jgi:hypothetical protein